MKKILSLILLSCVILTGCGSNNDSNSKPTRNKVEQKESKKMIGKPFKAMGLEITINEPIITKNAGIQGVQEPANGNFYIFNMTVKNISKEPITLSGGDFNFYVNKAKHENETIITNDQPKQLLYEKVSPDTIINCFVAFDVAEGANIKGSYIEFDNNKYDNKKPVKAYLD